MVLVRPYSGLCPCLFHCIYTNPDHQSANKYSKRKIIIFVMTVISGYFFLISRLKIRNESTKWNVIVLQSFVTQVTGCKVISESGYGVISVCVTAPSCPLFRRNRVLHSVLHQGQRANGTQIHVHRWRQSCFWFIQVSLCFSECGMERYE